jgi:hypothetical protein
MVILFFAALLNILPAYADSAFDRCRVQHCTCEVQRGPRPTVEVNSREVRRQHTVYFTEGSHSISQRQSGALSTFISNIDDAYENGITIIGYTDGCGSESYNRNLARERARGVANAIRQGMPGVNVRTVVHGERTEGHSSYARTVEIVVHSEQSLTTRIERVPADYYLIDGSASMWRNWRSFRDVVNASFKPGSRIYMSMMTGCYNGQGLNTITPQSGTEIWYSYWRVLQHMQHGQTLVIISDFNSNYPITDGERAIIRRIVAEKDITVRTIR